MSAPRGRAEARWRHPSTQQVVTSGDLAARLVDRLRAAGVAWPELAGAVLAARGRLGVDVSTFAARIGVDPAVVERAEAGAVAPSAAPVPLRRLLAAEIGREPSLR